MRITYNIGGMPHLERLRLGAKFIPCGHHRNLNFHDHEFSELSIILHSTSTLHWVEGKSHPLQRGDVILMKILKNYLFSIYFTSLKICRFPV